MSLTGVPLEDYQFIIQWHLTAKCDQKCLHCYMHDSETYKSELKNELSLTDCKRVIDDISDMAKGWDIKIRINFTGGDPLLRNDFFDIIKYARNKGIIMGILGNPFHVTRDVAEKLKSNPSTKFSIYIGGVMEDEKRSKRIGKNFLIKHEK